MSEEIELKSEEEQNNETENNNEEEDKQSDEWVELKNHPNYLINVNYPHQIIKKNTKLVKLYF